MSTCRFAIAYDGTAVADGRMSVKDLAPALLAVGELFDAANAILNEDAAKVEAHVKATSEGSFEVALECVQTSLLDQVVNLFSGNKVTAILPARGMAPKGLAGHRPSAIRKRTNIRRAVVQVLAAAHPLIWPRSITN